jgi:hypothetical protein
MIRGKEYEVSALEWFKKNFDADAIDEGGADSTEPDIVSPIYGIIEVKHLPAQSGQFTEATADKYAYSQDIINLFKDNKSENDKIFDSRCKDWVKNYYLNNKKVNYFIVFDKEEILFLTPEEYFDRYTFSCTYRFKKSGSRKATKKIATLLPPTISFYWEKDRMYLTDENYRESRFVVGEYMCYVNDEMELRILSSTKNATYILA